MYDKLSLIIIKVINDYFKAYYNSNCCHQCSFLKANNRSKEKRGKVINYTCICYDHMVLCGKLKDYRNS